MFLFLGVAEFDNLVGAILDFSDVILFFFFFAEIFVRVHVFHGEVEIDFVLDQSVVGFLDCAS